LYRSPQRGNARVRPRQRGPPGALPGDGPASRHPGINGYRLLRPGWDRGCDARVFRLRMPRCGPPAFTTQGQGARAIPSSPPCPARGGNRGAGGLCEYKDVEQVVDVVAETGIAAKVARLRPIAIIKG